MYLILDTAATKHSPIGEFGEALHRSNCRPNSVDQTIILLAETNVFVYNGTEVSLTSTAPNMVGSPFSRSNFAYALLPPLSKFLTTPQCIRVCCS